MKSPLALVCLLGFVGAFVLEPQPQQKDGVQRVLRNQRVWERMHREPPIQGGSPSRKAAPVETKHIMQRLDHFDPQNVNTWSMRYMANGEHYVEGGPLFIYVGGEWEISAGSISRGHVYDMAAELKGYLFYTEHRFYGQSHPTVDLRTDKLKYLNIDQALADLAHFVVEMRKTIPGAEKSGVIMIGGSYSATMVSWFRQKYPHLINGAWASSAPVFAKVEFTEYKEIVTESIRLVGGQSCADRIERAIRQTEELLDRGEYASVAQKSCSASRRKREYGRSPAVVNDSSFPMELIQDYEQQYAVQTAEITAQIGRIAHASGAERNKLISDVDRQLEESQELLEQIGLEIRDIPQNSRAAYTSRLNCYQAEWKRLQQEFNNAKVARSKAGYDSSVDDFDEIGIQEDQKRRLLDNTERMERTSNYLNDAYRISVETEQIGTQVLADLSQQRETIQRSRGRLRETDADLSRSSRILNSMIMRAMREKFILVVVVVAIFLVLIFSIYFSIS